MAVTITDIGVHATSTYHSSPDATTVSDSDWFISKISPTEINAKLEYEGALYTLWIRGDLNMADLPTNPLTLADLPKNGLSLFSSAGIEGVYSVVFSPSINAQQLNLLMSASSNSDYATSLSGNDVYINSAAARYWDDYYLYAGDDKLYQNHHLLQYVDVFHGGDGNDTLILPNASGNYRIQTDNYVWDELAKEAALTGFTIDDNTRDINSTQIEQVEQIQFSDITIQTKWLTEAQLLAQSNPSEFMLLTEMYLAYFNRAPDSIGLDYWASNVYEGQNNIQVASNFALTPEAVSAFGTITQQSSVTAVGNFVSTVYSNVLNRSASTADLIYWTVQVQTGAVTPSNFILAIVNAVNTQLDTSDSRYLISKTAVGAHFAITDGLTDKVQAHSVMNTFNTTYASSGAAAAISAANELSDIYLAGTSTNSQLVVQLVGVSG